MNQDARRVDFSQYGTHVLATNIQIMSSNRVDPNLDNTGAPIDLDGLLSAFTIIWQQMMLLAKQLRDVMQAYNQKKQELGWDIEVNTLKNKLQAITDSYQASRDGSIGRLFGGVLSVGGAYFGDLGLRLGGALGQGVGGMADWMAAGESRLADQDRAIADLQDKGAQSYNKTLDELLLKARDIMQQMMDMGKNLVDVLTQVLRALSRY